MSFKGLTINGGPDIFAQDDAAIYRSILGGKGDVFIPMTDDGPAQKLGDTTVRIKPCVIFAQGRVGRIASGDFHDVRIKGGTVGRKRTDLIVMEVQRSGSKDTMEIKVLTGASSTGSPAPPATKQEDLDAGGAVYQLPLFRVQMDGATLSAVTLLAPQMSGLLSSEGKTLSRSGGSMTGDIDMTQHRVKKLAEPTDADDAATKRYADTVAEKAKRDATAAAKLDAGNTYLPTAGGRMTGGLDMTGHAIRNVPSPEGGDWAASKSYVDNTAVPREGGSVMKGYLGMNGNMITSVGDPKSSGDAANKGYVDGKIRSGTADPTSTTCPEGAVYIKY